jgi:hypothetical protein
MRSFAFLALGYMDGDSVPVSSSAGNPSQWLEQVTNLFGSSEHQ